MEAEELAHQLRANGYRATTPRMQVHAELRRAGGHLTAEQLADGLADQGVTLSSVYRTLALLEELGVARATRLGEGDASRWELEHPDEHFHVVCEDCSRVTHHRGELVALVTTHLAEDHGFAASEVDLLVRGRCASCRDAAEPVPMS